MISSARTRTKSYGFQFRINDQYQGTVRNILFSSDFIALMAVWNDLLVGPESEPNYPSKPKLSLPQRFALSLIGHAKIGYYRKSPIYAAKCAAHGLYVDIPRGSSRELRCSRCEEAFLLNSE
jgi:hypothetical protein